MTNREKFAEAYTRNLGLAVANYPDEYQWPDKSEAQVIVVANKMLAAVDRNSHNKDSRAFRMTCKELGIKHTYQAIRAYIDEGV